MLHGCGSRCVCRCDSRPTRQGAVRPMNPKLRNPKLREGSLETLRIARIPAGPSEQQDARAEPGLRQRLPKVSAHEARLAMLFYGSRGPLRFCVQEQTFFWEWMRLNSERTDATWIEICSPRGEVQLTLCNDCVFVPALDIDWRRLSADERLLAWALRYEPVLTQLQKNLGLDLEPRAVSEEPPQGKNSGLARLDFRIVDAQGTGLLAGSVYLPPDLEFPHLAGPAAAMVKGRVDHVPVTWQLVVAECDFDLSELDGLAPGDVIALGSPALLGVGAPMHLVSAGCGSRICVRTSGAGVVLERVEQRAADIGDQTMRIERSANMTMQTPDSRIQEAGNAVRVDVEGIPVQLSFEVASITLSVGELSRLAPGYLFPLDSKPEEFPVTIRANGRVFARGEFVVINDFLGVRVVESVEHGRD
jgi:type III secretion system YscQ/HrcQ family protein